MRCGSSASQQSLLSNALSQGRRLCFAITEAACPELRSMRKGRPSRTKQQCPYTVNREVDSQFTTVTNCLVDLLHLRRLVSSALDLLQRRQVIVITEALVVIVDAQAQLDHAVDAAGKLRRLVKVEAGGEQGGVEQQPDQVLHRLVRLVRRCLLLQLRHDGVLRVHLHRLLGHHVRGHGVVPHGLRLHDALHVRGPAVLRGRQHAG
mmetsp:Transcript_98056/g.253588  ORF Transcript_98056/g.253588 Transcript_98056/m.253588 type:complete len:206 (-) Transcript_98056:1795-2412(-)